MSIEAWSPVPSQPGLLASSLGRIMVDPYEAPTPNGGTRVYGGVPTFGQLSGGRMIYVHKGRSLKVHRLVCEAFNGQPFDGAVCMHLDESGTNNRPENLAWGTQRENLNAPGFLAYCRSRTGLNSPVIKGRSARELQNGGDQDIAKAAHHLQKLLDAASVKKRERRAP